MLKAAPGGLSARVSLYFAAKHGRLHHTTLFLKPQDTWRTKPLHPLSSESLGITTGRLRLRSITRDGCLCA